VSTRPPATTVCRAESPTIRLAVAFLGGIALAAVAGIIGLSSFDAVPDVALAALSGIAGGASGALATLLTTFTPSPVPGGRRNTDLVSPIPMTETVERRSDPQPSAPPYSPNV
jgi:hypothetical protein